MFSDAGTIISVNYTEPITLGPGQSTDVDPIEISGPPGDPAAVVYTTNLSAYIGTGTLIPFQFSNYEVFQDMVTTNNVAIIIGEDRFNGQGEYDIIAG